MVIFFLSALSVLLRKLTFWGGLSGACVATALFAGLGYAGLLLLGVFFIAGTLATSYRKRWKTAQGLREAHGGQRRAVQVWANGGVAAALGLAAYFANNRQVAEYTTGSHVANALQVLAACALSAATADTLSSELGNAWGRRFINLRTLRQDARGKDGVISLEGTLAGMAGSVVIALLFAVCLNSRPAFALVIAAAGIFGNLADSWLGATWQRKGWMGNDAVNLANTLAAAAFGAALLCVLRF
jgi:uncharacterized protein (TIGR00297 family)